MLELSDIAFEVVVIKVLQQVRMNKKKRKCRKSKQVYLPSLLWNAGSLVVAC